MKVALLITGQPRYFEQGAWWLKNKAFVENNSDFIINTYCYFWDNGDPDLKQKVSQHYNTNNVTIHDYTPVISDFITSVVNTDKNLNGLSIGLRENLLFDTPEITKWGYNFFGQYLAMHLAISHYENELKDYDIIIKTRSDCIFNNMDMRHWTSIFHNIHRNPVFTDKLFADWLYIKSGQPYHGDYVFVGTPKQMIHYGKGIKDAILKICTSHVYWWKECDPDFTGAEAHWVWNRINYFTKNDWLSIAVVWPTPFSCTLIRKDDIVYNLNYQQIKQIHDSN